MQKAVAEKGKDGTTLWKTKIIIGQKKFECRKKTSHVGKKNKAE